MNNSSTSSRRRRIGLALGATAFALTSGLVLAAPASASTELEAVEDSLVHVYIEYSGYVGIPDEGGVAWSDRITVGFRCTGWFASDQGHIATAGHCVDPADGREVLITKFLTEIGYDELYSDAMTSWPVEGYDAGSEIDHTIEVVQANGASDPVIDEWTVAELVDYQDFESGDAALLKVAGVTGTTPLQIAAGPPAIGDDVVSIGFPGALRGNFDDQRRSASFMTGSVSSHQVTDRGVPVIEINAQVSGGMSGGPTIDAAGNVVGINSFGIDTESQSFNFVTDTEGLVTFLTRNGVETTQAAADTATTREGTDGTDELASAASAGSSGGASGSSDSGLVVPILLGMGGFVTVGLTVIAILVARRKSPQPTAGQPLNSPAAYANVAAPVGFAAAVPASSPGYLEAPTAPTAWQGANG